LAGPGKSLSGSCISAIQLMLKPEENLRGAQVGWDIE
jgi:hypothetical protein